MGIPEGIMRDHGGEFAEELLVAAELTTQAGQIALDYHGEDISVDLKAGDEPVTAADRECSDYIVQGLRQAFPEDVVISEEIADDPRRTQARRVWYVDPIDGTKSFIRGEHAYCVMIGLTLNQQPTMGVLYQPNFGSLAFAAKGAGAWILREERCTELRTTDEGHPKKARHLRPKGTLPANWQRITELLGLDPLEKVSSIGLKLCTIAIGASDLYVNPYTNCSSWDTCAPQVILEEAGGRLSDMHGLPLRYDLAETTKHSRGLVASNGTVHSATLASFADLYPDPDPR